jgi:hypothetical protein
MKNIGFWEGKYGLVTHVSKRERERDYGIVYIRQNINWVLGGQMDW